VELDPDDNIDLLTDELASEKYTDVTMHNEIQTETDIFSSQQR
jgi:hypothetical protein